MLVDERVGQGPGDGRHLVDGRRAERRQQEPPGQVWKGGSELIGGTGMTSFMGTSKGRDHGDVPGGEPLDVVGDGGQVLVPDRQPRALAPLGERDGAALALLGQRDAGSTT
ncbi:hypothetical protein [Actinomarinicola tropica]|uniref:Uncharacterized protein n=1 Tax=Actinomarinicola tropica TaxID=2789776 RepID=A0A5Q2RJ83_9ACTN|nr:hypothetical protein [Actinomarinicola tropica]QGG94077.1 hypothetical protein GH723_02575 [Actinomarinicola tropica]